jgi:hypothetical protein
VCFVGPGRAIRPALVGLSLSLIGGLACLLGRFLLGGLWDGVLCKSLSIVVAWNGFGVLLYGAGSENLSAYGGVVGCAGGISIT